MDERLSVREEAIAELQWRIESLKGWRAEVGLLASGPGMFRIWEWM